MDVIDEEGRLFGAVNIIDALVVLLVLAVALAGAALVFGTGSEGAATASGTSTATITLRVSGVQPYVADAVSEGNVRSDAVVAVENKSVEPTRVVVEDRQGELHERVHPRKRTLTLRVTLNVTETEDGTTFRDEPLEIGRTLELDLGDVTVRGNVTRIGPSG